MKSGRGSNAQLKPSKKQNSEQPDNSREISATVIRHKPAGRQALPSQWLSQAPDAIPPKTEPQEANKEQCPGNGKAKKKQSKKKRKDTPHIATQGVSSQTTMEESKNHVDTTKATKESQVAPEVVTESNPTQVSQNEPNKMAKKKKKPAKRGPSSTEQASTIASNNESLLDTATTTEKPYRANAGGSLHISRQRYKPAIRNVFKPHQTTETKEQARKKIHGSFGNLDVGFNPWPRAPSGEVWSPTKRPTTPAPPQVVIEPATDTVTEHGLPTPSRVAFKDTTETIGFGEEIYAHRSHHSSKKPSGSSFVSLAESQHTTASR